jgi:hypothetical protein
MTHRSETAPPASHRTPREFCFKSRLLRGITVVLAVKLLVLIAIKLAWFSDPPTPEPPEVARALLGPVQPPEP